MADPILPEQVPDHLVEIADQHYSMHGHGLIRNILAAVLTQDRADERRSLAQHLKDTASGMRAIKYGDDADGWWHRVRRAEALDFVAELVAEGLPDDKADETEETTDADA